MAYNPISGAAIQYVTSAGNVASGYFLKFYIANTTTPLSMATDATGGTALVKCKLNDKGYPISNPSDNSTVFIPHVNASYRFVLYVNESDADANTTANADVNIPDIAAMVGAESVGTAAFVDHGTASGEIPLNSDLGTASLADLTTGETDITGALRAEDAYNVASINWHDTNFEPAISSGLNSGQWMRNDSGGTHNNNETGIPGADLSFALANAGGTVVASGVTVTGTWKQVEGTSLGNTTFGKYVRTT